MRLQTVQVGAVTAEAAFFATFPYTAVADEYSWHHRPNMC